MRASRRLRGYGSAVLWFLLTGCVFSVGAVLAAAGSEGKHVDDVVGLWVGVDSLDGSPVRLSLSDVDKDGVLELTLQEDFWSNCFDVGPAYSRGRGVLRGTGIVTSKSVIKVTTELFCIDDNNVSASRGVAEIEYTLASRSVLVLPAFGSSPAIVLHRVSS